MTRDGGGGARRVAVGAFSFVNRDAHRSDATVALWPPNESS